MKRLFVAMMLLIGTAHAEPVQLTGFGIGLMIGDPTAFTFKGYVGNNQYFDVAVGNNSGPADGLYAHGDFLFERPETFEIEEELFNLYYGIGVRSFFADDKQRKDEFHLGARVPVGVNYYLKDPSVEFFGEIAVAMDLTPETDTDIDLGIGARYWF